MTKARNGKNEVVIGCSHMDGRTSVCRGTVTLSEVHVSGALERTGPAAQDRASRILHESSRRRNDVRYREKRQ